MSKNTVKTAAGLHVASGSLNLLTSLATGFIPGIFMGIAEIGTAVHLFNNPDEYTDEYDATNYTQPYDGQ